MGDVEGHVEDDPRITWTEWPPPPTAKAIAHNPHTPSPLSLFLTASRMVLPKILVHKVLVHKILTQRAVDLLLPKK